MVEAIKTKNYKQANHKEERQIAAANVKKLVCLRSQPRNANENTISRLCVQLASTGDEV